MEIVYPYTLIIPASIVLMLSFFFGEIAKKTNIPSVLMLIGLGVGLQFGIRHLEITTDFLPILTILGTVGLIMIVLEAALELELKREKYVPIAKAFLIALIGLMISAFVAAHILHNFIPGMTMSKAWLYATPLSILSSAIIIPSVVGLGEVKREFHIYESTFSDILGILVFYFLLGQLGGHGEEADAHSTGIFSYGLTILITIVLSLVASYLIVIVFQSLKGHTKLFLLIAVLLLLYSVGKAFHLSSLIIILVFGLLIANVKLFFKGPLRRFLNEEKIKHIYEGLHVITMETAFVVRTYFFVIFGITISLATLLSAKVAMVSLLIIVSIYLIRLVLLYAFLGRDVNPQLFIAPRGLITILLFYQIPKEAEVAGFDAGILLFIIIGTSLIMTYGMIFDKKRAGKATRKAKVNPVGYAKWKAPSIEEKEEGH